MGPDYISPEEIEALRRRGEAERRTKRLLLILLIISSIALALLSLPG